VSDDRIGAGLAVSENWRNLLLFQNAIKRDAPSREERLARCCEISRPWILSRRLMQILSQQLSTQTGCSNDDETLVISWRVEQSWSENAEYQEMDPGHRLDLQHHLPSSCASSYRPCRRPERYPDGMDRTRRRRGLA
jgi:hypothetical protein